MRTSTLFLLLLLAASALSSQSTIHVFVALCDNAHQGILPVPESIGNGQDPRRNLYWGAGYGVRNFFDRKSEDWELVDVIEQRSEIILDRVVFRHKTSGTLMLADAYDGRNMKDCLEDYFEACNGQLQVSVSVEGNTTLFGGSSGLIGFVGHNGLMDTEISPTLHDPRGSRDAFALGCYTRDYFTPYMKRSGARPVCWTTHLMAPEAYSVHAIVNAWIAQSTPAEIEEAASQAYHHYQKCGLKGARNLMASGYRSED